MNTKEPGAWIFKGLPRDFMQRVKIAAAIEGRTVKDMVLELLEQHLKEMEKKGLLPKGKGRAEG
jgi:plasmid stability protein